MAANPHEIRQAGRLMGSRKSNYYVSCGGRMPTLLTSVSILSQRLGQRMWLIEAVILPSW